MKRWLLAVLALVVIALIALAAWHFLRPQPPRPESARSGQVAFSDRFGTAWYDLAGGTARSAAGPAGFDADAAILEIAAATGPGPRAALASGGKEGGTILGSVEEDGSFTPALDDGTIKSSLVAGQDGMIAYAALLDAPASASPAPTTTPRAWKESDPVPPPLSFTSFGGRVPTIQLMSPGAAKPRTIAPGRPFGALANGDFLILTQDGIAALSPRDASTTLLVPSTSDLRLAAAFSSWGDTIAYLNPASGSVDVYHVEEAGKHAIYAFSARASAPVESLAFLDPTRLLMKTASSTLESIGISATTSDRVPRFPTVKITAPDGVAPSETPEPATSTPIEDIIPD
jgi:hypothetical protein